MRAVQGAFATPTTDLIWTSDLRKLWTRHEVARSLGLLRQIEGRPPVTAAALYTLKYLRVLAETMLLLLLESTVVTSTLPL